MAGIDIFLILPFIAYSIYPGFRNKECFKSRAK
jgi:hypothetical protein